MKKQTINIKSLAESTQVIIQNGNGFTMRRRFGSVDEAIAFVLPRGNLNTELYLNGFPCVLHGWIASGNHSSPP
jgi:hypothetical protein